MRRLSVIFLKVIAGVLCFVAAVVAVVLCYGYVLYASADMQEPEQTVELSDYNLLMQTDSLRICKGNSLLLNEYGLWECVLRGSPEVIGASYGVMAEDLLRFQEDAFVGQIRDIIPSEGYLRFLRAFLEIFNRDMASHVPLENRREIAALALSCTHDHDVFGTPYERQMHYHAAHDIGHMMQEYMLVGCSSFAVWGSHSADSSLLVGRNFDFYVGEDFARNRQVLFVTPDEGFRYASVSWPGMTGVVSGMNEKGLTVTLNAAKGSVPTASAMPISILARRILQYAENIEQACSIAADAKTFVSESLLIASAQDGCAAIIEKTPRMQDVFRSDEDMIVCTNHYQSDAFLQDEYNMENIASSDSYYRWERMTELLHEKEPVDPADAVSILRERRGKGGSDIGYTNEKSLNQDIAHHSVVFQPESLRMWVSTSPWQSGAFVCYDLNEIFSMAEPGEDSCIVPHLSLVKKEHVIGADDDFIEYGLDNVREYRRYASVIRDALRREQPDADIDISAFIGLNPSFYEAYDLAGDYMEMCGGHEAALNLWNRALTMEIPRLRQVESIKEKTERYDKE